MTKWSEQYYEGTWWERNQQAEFRLYEPGHSSYDAEGMESIGIPVTLDEPLVIECIMYTFIDNYPDPYYQSNGQTWIMVKNEDQTNSNVPDILP